MTSHKRRSGTRRHRLHVVDPQRWYARLVLIGFATLSGLAVVALDRIGDLALKEFHGIASLDWWVPLLWLPACTVAILWLTRTLAPRAAGSGIPQVLAVLDDRLSECQQSAFVSVWLSAVKLLLTCLGLLAGLSLGREGPSVQIAAGIMQAARAMPGQKFPAAAGELVVAGGAAGIAAAFNAPLAGVMFAIEELSRTPEQRRSGLMIGAIVFAGLVAVAIEGDASYFGVIHAHEPGFSLLIPALLLTLVSGVTGGIFSRLMILASRGSAASPVLRWRAGNPMLCGALLGLFIATIGLVSQGATFGSGYQLTRSLLDGGQDTPLVTTGLKFLATWLTSLCMVPGGIFAPSLSIGASLGHDISSLCAVQDRVPLIALGMVGFLAATTQAPMTAFIVVMEMVDGHQMIFSLMICAAAASSLAKLLSPPLYASLADGMVRQVIALPDARAK